MKKRIEIDGTLLQPTQVFGIFKAKKPEWKNFRYFMKANCFICGEELYTTTTGSRNGEANERKLLKKLVFCSDKCRYGYVKAGEAKNIDPVLNRTLNMNSIHFDCGRILMFGKIGG